MQLLKNKNNYRTISQEATTELVLHTQTLTEKQNSSCCHICSFPYSVHKYPMKLKCSLIMTLLHNCFILSNWSENLKQLINALCKINLINKGSKCNSLMIEIQNS